MLANLLITALLPLVMELPPADPAVPLRQPYAASANGRTAVVYGAGNSIFFIASTDNARTFSLPVKVAEVNVLALGRHRGPRVTILKDSYLVTAVAGEHLASGPHAHGLPSDGNLTAWRSVDQGKTWTRLGVINDVPGAAREGFHSISADAEGRLTAVWLDLREKGTKLYSSRSLDGGRTWSKNTMIYASPEGTICECCNASIASDAAGGVAVMWRNVLEGSRDFYSATAKDGVHFGAPQKVGAGTWKINACPMDGGGLVLRDGQPFSAWRREKDVYFVAPGKPEVRIGSGTDVAMVSTPQGIFVSWTETSAANPKEYGIVLASPSRTGGVPENPTLIGVGGAFSSLAALPDGGIFAIWEEFGRLRMERIRGKQ
ncbi:MAG: exo-alpha-sialidase [Bryobacteraceae bacterium]